MTVSVSASHLRLLVRLFLFGGLLVLATSPVQAQQVRVIEKTVDLAPEGDVAVVAERGSIRVEGWDRSVVEVTAQVRDWEADRADQPPVSITKEGSTVRINTADADPDGAGLWRLIGLGGAEGPVTNYSVRMPASASLSVTTQEGSVEIQGLASEVVAEGYSASMEIRDLSGKATAATYSGPLRAENVRGPLTLATFSGDTTVQGAAPATKHTVASFSGDAEIAFPADAAFDLQTSISWGGGVTSDFPLPDSTAQGDGPVSIGGGGPTVTFESFSGSLTLRAE
jgi:hypothetical protein